MNQSNTQNHKDMYVVNLDMVRIFWILAILLFMLTFFFLFGYWLGNDTSGSANFIAQKKSDQKNWISYDKNQFKELLELQKVKKATENALTRNTNSSVSSNHSEGLKTGRLKTERLKTERLKKKNQRDEVIDVKRSIRKPLSFKKKKSNIDVNLSSKKPYAVQVSINRVFRNAKRLDEDLKREGFSSYVYKRNSKNGLFNIVRVGPFSTYSQALSIQKKLRVFAKDSMIITQK